jgi:hypothetical protein
VTRRERIARDMARKSGVKLEDYPFGSRPYAVRTDLDNLRQLQDPALRQAAWELYWLVKADREGHNYRLDDSDQEELERRFP